MRRVFVLCLYCLLAHQYVAVSAQGDISDAEAMFLEGDKLEKRGDYVAAGNAFFLALTNGYPNIHEAFDRFKNTYAIRNKIEYAFLRIGKGYESQGDAKNAMNMYTVGLEMCKHSVLATGREDLENAIESLKGRYNDIVSQVKSKFAEQSQAKTFQEWYKVGNEAFGAQRFMYALEAFENALKLRPDITYLFTSIVYLRTRVCKWKTYARDMIKLENVLLKDLKSPNSDRMGIVVEPHMLLGLPLHPSVKLDAARLHSQAEMRRMMHLYPNRRPIVHSPLTYRNFKGRIRVGFISADFRLKATAYLILRMFENFDRSKFEIFAFATTEDSSESDKFRAGVDWRPYLESGVEHFVDMSSMTSDEIVDEIHKKYKIHILVDMDGFSNNGLRAEMVFPMQPAPLQVNMLVYVGTRGAPWIQYVVTDPVASPLEYEDFYSEKMILMPQSFFVNSHALIPDIKPPIRKSRGFLNGKRRGVRFCNFNKHLKISPLVFGLWMNIMTKTAKTKDRHDSILTMLHFPRESEPFIRKWMKEKYPGVADSRVRFLPFVNSPYEHQLRIAEECDILLDNTVYNAHTSAVDALWGATPMLTWGNGLDQGGRVGFSIYSTLLPSHLIDHVIARDSKDYVEKAVALALDQKLYRTIVKALENGRGEQEDCDKCTLNPFWDIRRYVRNLESGFEAIWLRYLQGLEPDHIDLSETSGWVNEEAEEGGSGVEDSIGEWENDDGEIHGGSWMGDLGEL